VPLFAFAGVYQSNKFWENWPIFTVFVNS
jgi:hypothetical protein